MKNDMEKQIIYCKLHNKVSNKQIFYYFMNPTVMIFVEAFVKFSKVLQQQHLIFFYLKQ